jgi:phage FluMu protein Com
MSQPGGQWQFGVDERGKRRLNSISRQPESSCMDIRFECEKCGQLLVIEEAGAGISIPCPSCSANLIVPVADKTADKPASDFFSQTRELKNAVVKAAVSLLFPPGANIPDACFDVWDNRARARGEILTELRRIGSVPKETALQDILNDISSLDSILKTIQDVACGVDHFIEQNYDEIRVDEFPALQFHRVYSRKTSRDWPARWIAAAQASCDSKAEQIFQATGKMIALKSSGIWQALGDGVGGYEDALGNPFAPFAFDSGFDVDEVPRSKCEKIGLLALGEKVESAIIPSNDEIAGRFAAKLSQFLEARL